MNILRLFLTTCLMFATVTATVLVFAEGLATQLYTQAPYLTLKPGPQEVVSQYENADVVAISVNDKWIASSLGNQVRIWNGVTGERVLNLDGHAKSISALAFNENNTLLASGSDDGKIRLWDVFTGKSVQILTGQDSKLLSLKFGRAGKTLLSVNEDGIFYVWDVEKRDLINTFNLNDENIGSAIFNSDGTQLATCSADSAGGRKAHLWNVATGRLISSWGQAIRADIRDCAVAFSPDSKTVALSFVDQWIHYWQPGSNSASNSGGNWEAPARINSMTFSPDGEYLAVAVYSRSIWVLNARTQQPIQSLQGQVLGNSLTFSSDGKKIASAGGSDKTVNLWYSPKGMPTAMQTSVDRYKLEQEIFLKELESAKLTNTDYIDGFSISPDGQTLASTSYNPSTSYNHLSLWNLKTHKLRQTIGFTQVSERHGTRSYVSYTTDGKRLLVLSMDGIFKIWEIESQKLVHQINGKGNNEYIHAFSLGRKGRQLVLLTTRSDTGGMFKKNNDGYDRFEVYRLSDMSLISSFVIPDDHSDDLSYDDEANIISLSGSWGELQKIDATSGKILHIYDQQIGYVKDELTRSLDGSMLASTGTVWDASSGRKLLEGYDHARGSVVALAFSPDGKILLSGSIANKSEDSLALAAYSIPDGKLLYSIPAYIIPAVDKIVFTPDGKNFAAGNSKNIYLFDTKSGRPKKR